MKIKLESPFILDFKAGYLNINKEPRRLVFLVRVDGTTTTVSYARYLMSVKLNRYLSNIEHVDHIDGNKLNDTIENLQILTPKENNQKRTIQLGLCEKQITLTCPICKNIFSKPAHNLQHKLNKGKTPTCSRTCGSKYGNLKKKQILVQTQ